MQAIYCRRHRPGSVLLRAAMWSSWSHCGIITPQFTVIEACSAHGVIERPLEQFLPLWSRYSVKTIALPNDAAAIGFARSQLGKPYDWAGAAGIAVRRQWDDPASWFCSELLEAAAAFGGRQRFVHNAWRVTPQHSWMVA
jgi:uncharacterized protein YycO